MKKTHSNSDVDRRVFLKGAVVSTVAISSAGLAGTASADPHTAKPAKCNQGYRLTPHINDYYRVARF